MNPARRHELISECAYDSWKRGEGAYRGWGSLDYWLLAEDVVDSPTLPSWTLHHTELKEKYPHAKEHIEKLRAFEQAILDARAEG